MPAPRGRPAVFLDRDGTLIEDRGHLCDPSQVVLYPDTIPALHELQNAFTLFVVTNQSGVAKGLITHRDVEAVNGHLLGELTEAGIRIARVYVCPHQRADCCQCIKPNPHFLLEAAREFGIDLTGSFTVGDHPGDVLLGANAGATGVFVLTGHGSRHAHELPAGTMVTAGIGEAARWIMSFRGSPTSPDRTSPAAPRPGRAPT